MMAALLPVGPTLWRGTTTTTAADDMAATRDRLRQVATGAARPTLRLYRPPPTVAFGRRETHEPGFAAASAVARRHGYAPVVRNAGGRAVAYDPGSVVVELMAPDPLPASRLTDRFAAFAGALAQALRGLGIDARVGRLAGEYCPGDHSVIAGDRKLAGTAQRIVAGGWLCTASIVVTGAAPLRAVLADVYQALGFDWRPGTLGAVADVRPEVDPSAVEAAVAGVLGGVAGAPA